MIHTVAKIHKIASLLCACALALVAVGCGGGSMSAVDTSTGGGGGGSTPTGNNVVSVIVDGGPTGVPTFNTPFVTVTVCAPNTATCQTIDHIEVDTGSSGLRLISSVVTSTVLAALPQVMDSQNRPVAECLPFADGYSWGSVRSVDLTVGGEKAAALPIEIIGDPVFPLVPSDCSSGGGVQEDTVATFGANGILGISTFQRDCGSFCVTGTPTPGLYFACPNTGCLATTLALSSQVANPVILFATDNNGSILQLPAIGTAGAATVTGSLIFGIDTESNNSLGTATVLTVDPNTGNLTVLWNNQTLTNSFIDSGSNGNFFTDSSATQCASNSVAPQFYCPSLALSLSTTLQSTNAVTKVVTVSVANAVNLLDANASFVAFDNIAGTNSLPQSFDYGAPFFYGKSVYTAIELKTTSAGAGPFVAF